jgi:nucleoside-diphosphate-sugar epimerase
MEAAVNGTLQALQAAVKEPRVKSVVFMSSMAAVVNPSLRQGTRHKYMENDWNEYIEQAVVGMGTTPVTTPMQRGLVYTASKTAAERALWRFRTERKPNFGIMSIMPR